MTKPFYRIVSGIRNLAPWPSVATRVLEVASAEDAVPADVVALLQTDAALTAKILKLCNSAFYGFQREVSSLTEAGNKLGVDTLVNLVLTSCAGRYFQGDADSAARKLWEHSVRNAVAAGVLARACGGVDADAAYTAALLGNIGFIVVHSSLGEYEQEIEHAVQAGLPRLVAEREVLGLDHAHIGARLARNWGLPEVLVDAIANHHTPSQAEVDPLLTSIVCLAEALTEQLCAHERDAALPTGAAPARPCYPLPNAALQQTGFDGAALLALEADLEREIERAGDLMNAL